MRTVKCQIQTLLRPTLQRLNPKLPEFRALAAEWDPTGAFRNDALDRLIFTED